MREDVDPRELTPHPKNKEIYGNLHISERFVEDIEVNGVAEPLTATENSYFVDGTVLTSGHRRCEAAIRAGKEKVPVISQSFESAEEELAALLRANDYRQKSFRQQMGEADVLFDLHEAGHQNFGATKADRREYVGDRVGIGSDEQVRKAKKVWDAAKAGDELASELVEGIDSGDESIHSAYTTYRKEQTSGVKPKTPEPDGGSSKNNTLTYNSRVVATKILPSD